MEITEKIIRHIGDPAETLIDAELIDDKKFEYLFSGDTDFFTKPEKGLRLVFNASTRILNSVQFTLIDTTGESDIYRGQVPTPFTNPMNKALIRSLLGEPDKATSPQKIPVIGLVGGADIYLGSLPAYPNLKVRCLYTAEFLVHAIVFDLMDPSP